MKTKYVAGAAVATLLVTSGAQAGTLYISNLSQANENPPTGALFTGTGFLILNDAETSATITATHNITLTLTGGHIHRGTAAVNGPVIFPFVAPYTSPVGPLVWAIPAADVVNLKNLGLYMNFHTSVNPGGAIRGTLMRALTSTAAATGAQMRVANALDVSAGYNSDLDSVLMSSATASAATRTQTLEDLSGRQVYAQGRQAIESMAGFEDSLFSHADDLGTQAGEGFAGFVKGGSAFGSHDAYNDQAGSKVTRPYVLGGVDYRFSPEASAGVGVGYADGSEKFINNAGQTKAKTTSMQGYVSAGMGGQLVFTAVGGYGWTKFTTSRALTSLNRTATSSHNGTIWSLAAKVAAPFAIDNGSSIAPYALLDTQQATVDAYTETGAGSVSLVVPKLTAKESASELGAAFRVPMGSGATSVTANLTAGWRYLLNKGSDSFNTTLVGSPVAFSNYILSPGKNSVHLAANLGAVVSGGLTASVGYQGLVSSRRSIHAVEARLILKM
ncbi:MAG: autotransporter domain-containing protein [Rhodospirillaceae bacterium]